MPLALAAIIRCCRLILVVVLLPGLASAATATPAAELPAFTAQLPERAAQYAGEPFSLAVEAATGSAPLTYQWRKDGMGIPGATSATLEFSALTLADAGVYEVVVTNRHGKVASEVCDLTVVAVPDLANFTPPAGESTRYHAQGNAVIGINQRRFFNRPHYKNNTNAFILTGDKPMVKFASGGTVHGHFLAGVQRGSGTKWLHDFTEIAAAFQPAHTTWRITDPAFPGLVIQLQVLALGGTAGFAVRATTDGARDGDQLVWAYGGASKPGGNLNWSLDPYPVGEATLLKTSFEPARARANSAQVNDGALAGSFTVAPQGGGAFTFGRVTAGSLAQADATAWQTPVTLAASQPAPHPMIVGSIPLSNSARIHWSFTRASQAPATLADDTDPTALFSRGLARSADLASRLMLETPDPRVNAAAAMAVAGVDGAWYGNKFVHGSMSWNSPYLGWRTTIGGTMLGWHDRVKTSVDTYLATQVVESEKISGEAMGGHQGRDYLLTKPGANSRFYGKGYISGDQTFYEMQTQYFDQILQDWRWRLADDSTHEAKLRRGVELHLERFRECYDPDDNGTYESVINTWPTDCIWFNGGGCADATAYAHRAHEFARDLAKRAGDDAAAAGHQARKEKIRAVFFKELWVAEAGHPGLFREQGGHQRLVNTPPDVAITYERTGNTTTIELRLQRDAALTVDLPVRASGITGVTVDGKPSRHEARPSFGQTIVRVTTPAKAGRAARIAVTTADTLPEAKPVDGNGITGSKITLKVADDAHTRLVSLSDPLGVLEGASITDNQISGRLTHNTDHRRVAARVKTGSLEQFRIFSLHILPNPAAPATTLPEVPANATWKPVDISPALAADITQIHDQQYLSPRPQTVSTRIGTDGHSPWCFPHWGASRPRITLNKVPDLLDRADSKRLVTPQGVPFLWGGASTNVAFASLWYNWPDKVTVPVNEPGDAAWFLICGSTTVMQNRIANAALRLSYADGVEETLDLVPPYNYWNHSPITGMQARAQFGASYYGEGTEAFTVPKPWPMTVELGENCRAMVLNRKLRPGVPLESVTLEALSQESVIGLMGVSIMNPKP